MEGEEIKQKILEVLKNSTEPLTQTQISERVGSCPASISKYVSILQAEGKVKVNSYGNVNLVRIDKHEGTEQN